jgi:hypothetical protein
LRIGEDFVDVTLACEGQSLQAHKVDKLSFSHNFKSIFIYDILFLLDCGLAKI